MNITQGLNILLAPLGAFILVMLDYAHHPSADRTLRRLMLLLTLSAGLAIVNEFLSGVLIGVPGQTVHVVLYTTFFLFFVFQFLAFSAIPLFLDYYILADKRRVKKLSIILAGVLLVNLIALLVNIGTGFYFSITPDNFYVRGKLHVLLVLLTYATPFILLFDFLSCPEKIGRQQWLLGSFFCVPPILCGIIDMVVPQSRLLWPAFGLSLLCGYLFVVKTDYSVDSLTGVYNRRRCNEFLEALAAETRTKPYLFIMIDMDQFKLINDTFGHLQGDNALRDMANILRNSVRYRDFVARYGGDEFLLILETVEPPQPIAARIANSVEEFNDREKRLYSLEISIGYDVYAPSDARTPLEFLDQVDKLMYANKIERHHQ